MARKGLIGALESLLSGGEAQRRAPTRGAERLAQAVAAHMPDAEPSAHRLVTAVTGLLACVAYADHELAPAEERQIREELERIHLLPSEGVDSLCRLLREEIASITATGDHGWVRDLRELASRDMRLELLEVLVDIAAADDELALAEVNYLRRLTTALGLDQRDYDEAQSRHRDKLTTLR